MMRTVVLFLVGFGLLAVSDNLASELSAWSWVKVVSELSALGALIAAFAWLLRVEIPAMRRQNQEQQVAFGKFLERQQTSFEKLLDRITDRWDGWEQVRHEDHENLQTVLRETVAHCAKSQTFMEATAAKEAERAHQDAERAHLNVEHQLSHKDQS
jgi:hypothetical protein